ncbi:MAG: GHKL domain-containing protein, partial [Bacteroidetes bacterium]|nr:GHKL domain-containing protein [Bacteroidota bacterium]
MSPKNLAGILTGVIVFFLFMPVISIAQVANLSEIEPTGRFDAILLTDLEQWKYYPGDDLTWSDPKFDSSDWYSFSPQDLADGEIPDSLFNGIGWFRLQFIGDSIIVSTPQEMLLQTWGAAESYVDGVLLTRAGKVGKTIHNEVPAHLLTQDFYPLVTSKADTHTIAIRYSNFHSEQMSPFVKRIVNTGQAVLSNRFIESFNVGLVNPEFVNERDSIFRIIEIFLWISAVVLLLVIATHTFMYRRFPDRRENLHIALFSLLILIMTATQPYHFALIFSYPLIGEFIRALLFNSIPAAIAFFTPYMFSSLLKSPMVGWWKWTFIIIPTVPVLYLSEFSNSGIAIITGFYFLVSVGISLYFYFRTRKAETANHKVLLIGILGFPFFGIFWVIIFQFLQIQNVWIIGTLAMLIFITFPLSMTLFVTLDYTSLISGLEKKVSDRTRELRENNSRLREAKNQIQQQEVVQARDNLQKALSDLEAAKDQLVQQEKLASLGQLTAGIAHEIKNPLNFVNNFSDVSLELIEEAKEEVRRETSEVRRETSPSEEPVPTPREGNIDKAVQGDDSDSEAESNSSDTTQNPSSHRDPFGAGGDFILEILDDIEANLRKIHEHGTRADGIVKSMLEHSRGGSTKPEKVDINDLTEEFVNLSFHGMRAGKRPINVDLQFDLQENLPEVNLIAKDFSRVLINLCNNAFDAMWEKLQSVDFEPVLAVSTSLKKNKIYLSVEDNGPGIPDKISAKIMEPFFTTKQGTDGTGLGLSITSDIVKAHGGTLHVESEE